MLIINNLNMLNTEFKGRWTIYHLNEHFPIEISDSESQKVDTSDANVDTSVANVDTSGINVDTYVGKVDNSIFKVVTSTENVEMKKYEETRRRLPKSVLEGKILEVCEDDYLTLDEISKRVNKDVKYLKNVVIPRLIKENNLVRLYPAINHPAQAYKTKE